MSEKHGIKETREAIQALSEINRIIYSQLKDGFQWTDAANAVRDFLSNQEIREAFEGALKIKDEVGDLDSAEISELVMVGVQEGIQIVNEYLKK